MSLCAGRQHSALALGLIAPLALLVSCYAAAAPPHFVYENEFSGKWGSSGSGDGQFTQPIGIARDSEGNVFVVDLSNSRVQKFDASGTFLSKFGTFGAGDGQFFSPSGIAINNSDEIYVVDFTANRVQHFDSSGGFIRAWGTSGAGDGELQNPHHLTVAPDGSVYVADYGNDRIQVFQADGTFDRKFGTTGSGDGELSFPSGIAVDGGGNVYVVDAANNRVQVFNSSDTYVRQWGSTGSGDGQLDNPTDLALGADGIVYVTDANNDRVQAFTTEGVFLGKWGTTGNDDGQFRGPNGVMVTAAGRVYVSNSDMGIGNRVQFFEPIWNVMMDEDGDPTPFSLTLQANDGDMDTLTWSISGLAAHGTADASGTGTSKVITYTPEPDYSGEDSFEVQIDDGNAGTATRTVNVTLAPINDAPEIDQGAGPLTVTMSQDGNPDPFIAPVLTAIDPENDPITWSVSSAASHGAATVSGTGLMPTTFTYAPTAGYAGMDSFTIEATDGTLSDTIVVEVTITPMAEPPIIDQGEGPLAVAMEEDGVFTSPALSATDADTADGGLTWSIAVGATFGSADVSGTGATPSTFNYTPAPDFTGMDIFTVQVSDGSLTDTISIVVTVNSINDAPVIDQGAGPLAVTMSEDSTPTDFVAPALSASDVDSPTLTWSLAAPASNGTAMVSGTGASPAVLDYTPASNFTGSDSFTVQVSDGSLSDTISINVTVEAVNDRPTIDQAPGPLAVTMDEDGTFGAPALSASDIDTDAAALIWSVIAPASHGTATASGTGAAPTVLGYVPDADYNGADSFTVQVSDGALTDSIVIDITVNPVNDDPEITSSGTSVTMDEDGNTPDFSVLAIAASDVEGPSGGFVWSVSAQGSKGTAAVSPTGANPLILYVPRPNENGMDSFTLAVADGDGGSAEITLSVTINPQPDAPVITQGASVMATYTNQGSASGFDVPAITATDADGDTLTWSLLTEPGHGTASVSGNGASPEILNYSSEAGFQGSDSFVVAVADGDDNMDTITVNVTVLKENDAPAIVEGNGPLVVMMDEDRTFTAPTLSADDIDEDTLTWSVSVAAGSGTATVVGTGPSPTTFNYVPETNFNGTDRFTVAVSDGRGGSDSIEVIVSVAAVNDPPVIAQGDGPIEVIMDEDSAPIAFVAPELAATDVDSELSALTWSLAVEPNHGTAIATGTGATLESLTYTPAEDFTGEDSFVVAVSDGTGGFSSLDSIEIRVTVSPQPDAPEIAQGEMATVAMDEDGSPTAFVAPEITAVDVDGDTLTWSVVSPASHGVATASGSGTSPTVIYVPTTDYYGEDSFTVRVTDSSSLFDEFIINVTIASVFDPPSIQQGDSVTVSMDEDSSPTAFVAPELEAASPDVTVENVIWSLATAPGHGTAEANGTGATPTTISYVPDRDFNGTDQFTVQITGDDGPLDQIVVNVEIAAINDAPRFDTLVTQELIGSWEVSVPEGAEALNRLVLAIGPEDNVYVGDNTHIRIYSPEGTFLSDFAEISANALAVDGAGAAYVVTAGNEPLVKLSADGEEVDDWPAISRYSSPSSLYDVSSISASPEGAIEYLQVSHDLLIESRYSYLSKLNPAGRLSNSVAIFVNYQDGLYGTYSGAPINSRFVATRDREGNSYVWSQNADLVFRNNAFYYDLHISEELVIFSPQGYESRSIALPDVSTSSALRRLAVRPDGQRFYTSESTRGEIDMWSRDGFPILNFGDPEADDGKFMTVSGIAVNAAGRVYVSDQISGRVLFFEEAEAERNVTVSMQEDGTFAFPYSVIDPEGDIVTWTIESAPATGTATGGLSLEYMPPANFFGEVIIEASVEDEEGASTDITVNVVVEPVQDVPVITQGDADILVTMTENGNPVAFSPPALSATDVDGDDLTWTVQASVRYVYYFFGDIDEFYDPTVGTVAVGGTGASPTVFTYSPPQDYVGSDSFTVIVSDGKGNTDQVVVRVIVSSASASASTPVLAELLSNDFDNSDVNNDGMLSRLEISQRYPDITSSQFDEMDMDGDGFLSEEELEATQGPTTTVCNMEGDVKSLADTLIGGLVDAMKDYLSTLLLF